MNYEFGQIFRNLDTNEKYILARTSVSKGCLINLITGNRWQNPIKILGPSVRNCELKAMINGSEDEFVKDESWFQPC